MLRKKKAFGNTIEKNKTQYKVGEVPQKIGQKDKDLENRKKKKKIYIYIYIYIFFFFFLFSKSLSFCPIFWGTSPTLYCVLFFSIVFPKAFFFLSIFFWKNSIYSFMISIFSYFLSEKIKDRVFLGGEGLYFGNIPFSLIKFVFLVAFGFCLFQFLDFYFGFPNISRNLSLRLKA